MRNKSGQAERHEKRDRQLNHLENPQVPTPSKRIDRGSAFQGCFIARRKWFHRGFRRGGASVPSRLSELPPCLEERWGMSRAELEKPTLRLHKGGTGTLKIEGAAERSDGAAAPFRRRRR
jgi:hypothetical protein